VNSNGTAARQPAGMVAGPTAGSESTRRAQCCACHGHGAPATGSRLARRRQSVSHRPLVMLDRGQSRPGPGLGPASAAASSVVPGRVTVPGLGDRRAVLIIWHCQ
jgi:hypothetical protein